MSLSDSVAQLAAALSAAQAVMRPALKDADNPHFKSKYADLASVWEAIRKPLTDNGLCVVQLLNASGASVTVTTLLLHKSGERIASDLTLTARGSDPQSIASCVTYGRRLSLSATVGVSSDTDDDANLASRPTGSLSTPVYKDLTHAAPPPRPPTQGPQAPPQAQAPAAKPPPTQPDVKPEPPKLNDTQRWNVAAALIRKKAGDIAGSKLIEALQARYAAADGKVPEAKRAEMLAEMEATARGDEMKDA